MSDDFDFEENSLSNEQTKRMVSRDEFERRLAEKRADRKRKRIIFALICVAFLALVICLVVLGTGALSSLLKKSGAEVDTDYTMGDCLVTYDKKNVVCHNSSGTILWDYSLEDMTEPELVVSDSLLFAYDRSGGTLHAFGNSGLKWTKYYEGELHSVYYSETSGLAAVIYKDDLYKSLLNFFRVSDEGEPADIFTKNYASQYVVSCDISNNGKSVVLCGVSADEGTVTGVVSLINAENGDIYYTKHTEDSILPYVGFVNNEVVCAAGNTEILYIKNDMKIAAGDDSSNTVSIAAGEPAERLLCVMASGDGICAAAFGSGDAACTVKVFDADGAVTGTFSCEESVIGLEKTGDNVSLFTENKVILISTKGKLLGECEMFKNITEMTAVSDNTVLITYSSGYSYVEFTEE